MALPSWESALAEDWLGQWAINLMLINASTRKFGRAVRLQLHALAYDLANFLRTLTMPEAVSHWSMTTLRDRLVKIVSHGRSITFHIAEVMVPRALFQKILAAIAALRLSPPARC